MKNRLSASIQASLNERFGDDYDEYESEANRIKRKRRERQGRRGSEGEEPKEQPANLGQAISRFVFGKSDVTHP